MKNRERLNLVAIGATSLILFGCTQSSQNPTGNNSESAAEHKSTQLNLVVSSPEATKKKVDEILKKADWSTRLDSDIQFSSRDRDSEEVKATRKKRDEIVKELSGLGKDALPAIIDYYISGSRNEKNIARAVIRDSKEDAVEPLIAKMASKNYTKSDKRTFSRLLTSLGKNTYPTLEKLLESGDPEKVSIAAEVAANSLKNYHPGSRRADESEDYPLSLDVRPAILKNLKEHPDKGTRKNLAAVIPIYGANNEAIKTDLVDVYKNDKSPEVQSALAMTLGKLAAAESPEGATEILAVLSSNLQNAEDVRIRESAAQAIQLVPSNLNDDTIAALQKATKDNVKSVQSAAFSTLIRAARHRQDCAKYALEGLKSKDRGVVYSSITMIPYIGDQADQAVPDLIAIAKSGDESSSGRALKALVELGPKNNELLLPILKEKLLADSRRKSDYVDALDKMGTDAKAAIPELKAVVASNDPFAKYRAQRLLRKLGVQDSK